jgi:Sec-independent protein translocase protein TatA
VPVLTTGAMFDIGWSEPLVIGVVALVVIGAAGYR